MGGDGGGFFPLPAVPPLPPEDECKADKCDLEIYDSNDQLTTAELNAVLKKAAAQRKKAGEEARETRAKEAEERGDKDKARDTRGSTPPSGDPEAAEHLGSYEGTYEVAGLMGGEPFTMRKSSTYYPFLAVFAYDCPCTPTAELTWEKQEGDKWVPDAQEFTKAATAQNGDDDKLDGQCWKAVVDTPNISGKWKITGKVSWKENNNKCEEEWEVEIKDGVVTATETKGKDQNRTRSSKSESGKGDKK